ncbi:(2Fe-2S)-binding protein [Bradyrhizobium zhanjiangense]|uniref:(2Fe-2S)-binding protein n=1 Tax=Bradyrhizobium zhanjiangense TaxID=1325107 RepID=A0A4V1KV22_9BRAD|nr:2Fe-2S iron-sulfur cluster-binding protein [Bradyrhizobium zhanjiangense]RXG86700.1 (2Fe-2S)-binding protein [Bradyrhizobium zhanjiangense]
MVFTLEINGTPHEVDVDGDTPLLWVLRDVLCMTGTKFGCGQALCGACTVHVDGQPVRSCQTLVDSICDSAVTTIEAIGQAPQGAALQKAWLELEVAQCGYCQSAQIMSAAARLRPLVPDFSFHVCSSDTGSGNSDACADEAAVKRCLDVQLGRALPRSRPTIRYFNVAR